MYLLCKTIKQSTIIKDHGSYIASKFYINYKTESLCPSYA